VLCYHAVSPRWEADLSVTPERLERQISTLRARGYVPSTFTRALQVPSAKKTLAVTFDDGFASVYELAWPVLRRLGVPATLFVPTALIGEDRRLSWPGIADWSSSSHAEELRAMSWDQVRELDRDGWEIGSHTRTHPRLTTLTDDRLVDELAGSRHDIEEALGRSCRSIAYPYGDVDLRVVAAASDAGYATAATLPDRAPARPMPLMWPRVGVYSGTGDRRFTLKVSRGVRWLASSPLWSVRAAPRRATRARPASPRQPDV
jgi:peptidoglycan/xylan/chitin deacetylase (PgdA/CDA1 family)